MTTQLRKSKQTKPLNIATIEHLYKQEKLWLNPHYQREAVWTRSQKQLFIDSLLIEIDIPKLYFHEINHATKKYEYEVVDGQQRVRATVEFLNDEFRLRQESDPINGEETSGKLFSELSTDLQILLRNTSLDTVLLNLAYTEEDIEETFLRLQNGTPLTPRRKDAPLQETCEM